MAHSIHHEFCALLNMFAVSHRLHSRGFTLSSLLLLGAGWHTLETHHYVPLSTAFRKPRAPTLSQKGGPLMSPHGRDINRFVAACEALLEMNVATADLTEQEGQLIQYYIAALAAKFPALVE